LSDGLEGPAPVWTRPELAWPLSLVAGFAAAWAGVAVGEELLEPLVAPALVALFLLPLHHVFLDRAQPATAAIVALGGLVGAAGAVLGVVLEGGSPAIGPEVAFGAEVAREVRGLLGDGPAPEPLRTTLIHGAAFALALALGPATRGLAPLLAAAIAVCATAVVVGELAVQSATAGGVPLASVLAAWPPHAAGEVVALLLGWSGLAGLRGGAGGVARRRARALWIGGLALEGAVLLVWLLAARFWGRWAAGALGLS
jgi:hypothetical protein